MTSLDDYLHVLHIQGWWIEAWYPLSNGNFECRIRFAASKCEWGEGPDGIGALKSAMSKAGLL